MRVLSIVLSVFVLGGAALWTYLTVTEEERSAIEVHLEEGKTETVSFENLCLIPGERCEYELALDGGRAKQYKVAFDFVEIKEGTLKNYACARIESKAGVLYDGLLAPLLEENGTDVIVLAGFMSILSERFTSHFEKRILNVHPSLIPSFCGEGFYGLRVHQAALDYGVKVTGATVHFVNEIPDGGQIIMQKAVEIQPDDTPETLQKRVMEQAEWIILPLSVEKVCKEITEG
jgi:phosphoribosylglycinamide formyltransferase-1